MSTFEQQFFELIQSSVAGRNKDRNIQIALHWYGLVNKGGSMPTLEDIGIAYDMTRENVRQILDRFQRHIRKDGAALIEALPSLQVILGRLHQAPIEFASHIRSELLQSGVIAEHASLRGVLKLAGEAGLIGKSSISFYSIQELEPLSQKADEYEGYVVCASASEFHRFRKALVGCRALPGYDGMTSLSALRAFLAESLSDEDIETVVMLLRRTADVTFVSDGREEWFLVESRENALMTSCGKVKTLTDACDLNVLVQTLANAIRFRTAKHSRPTDTAIQCWIETSPLFSIDNGSCSLHCSSVPLTEIEEAIVQYLSTKGQCGFRELKQHLLGLAFGEASINKYATASPVVFIDKSLGKGSHIYHLVSGYDFLDDPEVGKYMAFKQRLTDLALAGTDRDATAIARREQAILRDWLFDDRPSESCAICGRLLPVSALVAAHKKKRSICTEAERSDPFIVFPLCLFGCDYMYESGVLVVEAGMVRASAISTDAFDVDTIARGLDGRLIDSRWLKGNDDYFDPVP